MTDRSCRNCDAVLVGRWCHVCGQDGELALRPFRAMLAELSEAALGWESRVGRTLRVLCFEPGRLTVEFAAGHRAGWLHPLRLYLGVSVVTLAVFGATSGTIVTHYGDAFGSDARYSQFGQLMLLISTAMFLLLPAQAATYAMAFRVSQRYYIEHLVLVLHATSFIFIAEAAASLLQYLWVLLDAPYALLVATRLTAHLAVLVYGWLAVRRLYGLGRWQTLVRLVLAVSSFLPVVVATVWLLLRLRS